MKNYARIQPPARKYANILMPIMNNLGYILYVLIALVGGTMAAWI